MISPISSNSIGIKQSHEKAKMTISEGLIHSLGNNPKFSIFKAFVLPYGIRNTTPQYQATISDVYKVITSPKYKIITEKLRSFANPNEAEEYKKTSFDYATSSGIFSKREDASLINHSGLICIDLDKLENLSGIKQKIITSDVVPELMFISPLGNGLKVIYRIDVSGASHLMYFKALGEYFNRSLI